MKKAIVTAALVLVSFAASAGEAKPAAQSSEQSKSVTRLPKGCPTGFVPWGVITKIETTKKGMVAETVRTNGGTIQKMPAFKPTKLYANKVGDAFCMDTTPDND
jgi:hypothetical protein